MSDNGSKDRKQDDLTDAGFIKLDDQVVHRLHPPKIKWGKLYGEKTDEQKITYLEKLAASMNHAAGLIQSERNELGRICEKKEEQLIKMSEAMKQNNVMLQQEVTRMNSKQQDFNTVVARLNQKIRELERGNQC